MKHGMTTNIAIIVVQNSRGQLFVHQRKDDKDVFPSRYGLGAGGKVNEGETPVQAAIRELREELLVEKTTKTLESLFSFPFTHPQASYDVHVFRAMHDGELTPCKREFQWSGWMTRQETDQLSEKNLFCPDTKIAYERLKRDYL